MKQTINIKKIMHESLHAKHGQSETFINSKKHLGTGKEVGGRRRNDPFRLSLTHICCINTITSP